MVGTRTNRRYRPVLPIRIPCTIANGEMVATKGRTYTAKSTGLTDLTAWNQVGLSNGLGQHKLEK